MLVIVRAGSHNSTELPAPVVLLTCFRRRSTPLVVHINYNTMLANGITNMSAKRMLGLTCACEFLPPQLAFSSETLVAAQSVQIHLPEAGISNRCLAQSVRRHRWSIVVGNGGMRRARLQLRHRRDSRARDVVLKSSHTGNCRSVVWGRKLRVSSF